MKHTIKSFSGLLLIIALLGIFGFVIFKVTKTPTQETSVKAEAELVNEEPQAEEEKTAEDIKSESTVQEANGDNGQKVLAKIKKAKAKSAAANKRKQQKIEIARRSTPIYQPLPLIPNDLRYEALKTQARARFYVAVDGSVTKIEFVKPCNEPKLNHLLEKSLLKWKFKPGTISFVQDINVTFKVE